MRVSCSARRESEVRVAVGEGGSRRCLRDEVMPRRSEACVASQSVDHRSRSAGGMGSKRRRGVGCGVARDCCSPRREEMLRERRTLWWSEKLDVLMVGVT